MARAILNFIAGVYTNTDILSTRGKEDKHFLKYHI